MIGGKATGHEFAMKETQFGRKELGQGERGKVRDGKCKGNYRRSAAG